MCSIEEAWAGQNFDGKKVVSQGDLHNSYMGLPDNIFYRENDHTTKKPIQGPLKNLPRGINSKYSREPRVPKLLHSTNNVDLNISSEMPEINNYGGLEPLPSFMSIYNNSNQSNSNQPKMNQSYSSNQSYPMPVMTGENFTDIENAYNVSDTLSQFMNTDDNLLNEDNDDDRNIINNKFSNMNTHDTFKNINKKDSKNKYSNADYLKFIKSLNKNDNNDNNNNTYNDPDIKQLLNTIIKKIDSIEIQLSNYNNKNIYDLILYIIIGILFSFCIYSIFNKKN